MTDIAKMNLTNCAKARHEATLYAAVELSEHDRPAYERHLAHCPECRSVVDAERAIARAAYRLPVQRPAVATLDALSLAARRHVAEREKAPAVSWGERVGDWLGIRRSGAPVLGWALAASLVLAIGVSWTGTWSPEETLSPALVAWNYDVDADSTTVAQVPSVDEIVPNFTWSDEQDDALSADLVALADDIDTLADGLGEF